MPRAGQFARETEVSSEKSRNEIERMLDLAGATKFVYGKEEAGAVIAFQLKSRQFRFALPLPKPETFRYTERRRKWRDNESMQAAYEQAIRQRWRQLALIIKAKLEAVETGIVSFEDEFLAYAILPNNQTVGQWVGPQLEEAYSHGQMPALIPGLESGASPRALPPSTAFAGRSGSYQRED